ncbi:hypothetical protein Ahy_A05g025510 [Arachis hypogaea]|uniref:PB1-like domain-containing protein n=1 Tax=Arachis hypogaea TaxID=3818 RepID=A0A445D8W3_ARAHY|nr:hypothetical protein Ahy_A05g025510 [Arachis hypogaea]
MYVGGEKSEIRRVNVDTINGFFINDLLRDIGYTMINKCYWLVPEMELNGGLKLLRSDKDIIEIYETALRNDSRICVYTEHPISLSEVVEEGDGNVASPSKGRKKICAKKTLTPRKKKPVPSQEYWQQLDTIPILPPHYKRPIGRPTKKRDTSRDAPKINLDPYRTKRKYSQIKCKYCLKEGHNSRSCKAKKEAMAAAATAADATAHGQNSSAATTAHVPPANVAQDEDDERMDEMYWERGCRGRGSLGCCSS